MGCRPCLAATKGHVGTVRGGVARPRGHSRQLPQRHDERHRRLQQRRRRRRFQSAGSPRRVSNLSRTIRSARDDGAQLRVGGRQGGRRDGDVLVAGDLSDPRHRGATHGLASRQGPCAVLPWVEHVRLELLHRRRGSGRDHVARTRQTGSRAVEPSGRVRVGQLRPGASRRHARSH